MGCVLRCLGMILALSLSGCAIGVSSAPDVHWLAGASDEKPSTTLLVMLPGLHDRASVFESHGFVEALRERGIDIHIALVDLHSGYYLSRSAVSALYQEVILPARQRGYLNIWLLGASLGGAGAILYAAEYPEQLSGLILLSPFPGRSGFVETLSDPTGRLRLPPDILPKLQMDTDALRGWVWMCSRVAGQVPEVYLAFGVQDRLAPAISRLSACSAPSAVLRNAGGHGWKNWPLLWAGLLDGPLGSALQGVRPAKKIMRTDR